MRYILIILVFLSVGAKAQMVIKAHANYRPYAQPAANLLLDDYPNAAAAYSLRKLDKDYTGAAIRVRKDTTGQPEQDIGFTASGDLDTAALKSFLNASSGFVTTWYDQSGSGTNALQNTQTAQPRIVNLGVIERQNGDVCIRFDGTNDWMNNVKKGANTTESNIAVLKLNSTSGQQRVLQYQNISGPASSPRIRLSSSNWEFLDYQASPEVFTIATTAADLNQVLLFGDATTTKTIIYKNGVKGTDGATVNQMQLTSVAETNSTLGTNNNGSSTFLNGWMFELIIYNSSQSSNRTGIENNINDYYNIYWNGDFTGLLDTYGSSAAAYSLRNLSSTYKGPLIRVRKDTTGQPEMDIYGDYYGNLDTVGLKSFLNARNGFVVTWYDQSGNARNATQSTQANQPRIANLGVLDRRSGDLAAVFDGSNDFVENGTNGFAINNISHYAVSSRGNSANSVRIIYSTGILASRNGFGFFYTVDDPGVSSQNNLMQHFRTETIITGIGNYTNTLNTNNLIFGYSTSSNDYTYYNGGNEKTTSHSRANVTSNGKLTIGARNTGLDSYSFYLNGTVTEIVFWEANQSSNRSGIQTNVNNYWSIY